MEPAGPMKSVSSGIEQLSDLAMEVLRARYLLKVNGAQETPVQMMERVATAAASVEEACTRTETADRYFQLLKSLKFLPNSPTLMNAGKADGQLSACFVIPIEDTLPSIFDALKEAALIHQSGGGTGFSFSRLRPKGSEVRTTGGVASGPLSFMKVFDTATETIKQGGARRGANMAVLRVDHPDILDFIDLKRDFRELTNFNISVGVTDSFMEAALSGGLLELREPSSGQVVHRIRAREVFDRLVGSAWLSGDPGLVFLDRMNRFNPTPSEGSFESTNPCGEQPLLGYESCNLGSFDLSRYWLVGPRVLDWDAFGRDIRVAVRFLDNVIDANVFPTSSTRLATLKTRKIGLGVMGFADLLLMSGLPYESLEARSLGEACMAFLGREARRASAELAREKGPFPSFVGSLWDSLGFPPLRNATVSTVAPTGTISLIAGCSSGIEPIFAPVMARNILEGRRIVEVHPCIKRLLEIRGGSDAWALQSENEQHRFLRDFFGPAWSPAGGVSASGHVQMQAAFQRHSDSAVSKTVNLPSSASARSVEEAYFLAYESGCKGITVFRDQSRPSQVMESTSLGASGGTCDTSCPEC